MTYTTLPPVCRLVKVGNDCCAKVTCDTPGTASTTTTHTTPTGACVDKLTNCNQYDKNVACVGDYKPWAVDNCPAFCGYCSTYL